MRPYLALAVVSLFAFPALAKEPPPVPRAFTAPLPQVVVSPPPPEAGTANLGANYAITLKGELYKGIPIDLTLRGAGPSFDAKIAEPNLAVRVLVEKNADAFTLKYAISMQVQLKGTNSFAPSELTGTIIVSPGSPEIIASSGEGSLSLGIDKIPDEKR